MNTPNNNKKKNNITNNKQPKENISQKNNRKYSFGEILKAVFSEIADNIKSFRFDIDINREDIIKALICNFFIVFGALMQTTFFARLSPFGAIPDLMIMTVAAIAVWEGEKWGAVCGLLSAFIITSLGSVGEIRILYLLYAATGFLIGAFSKVFFSNTFAVKAAYAVCLCFAKAITTFISAELLLHASVGEIFQDIVLPEFFSTLIISPIIFVIIHFALKPFHKTRAERTGN